MLAGATDVDVDNQGRILLPEYLKEYAQLKKNVIVAGLFNRMEISDEIKNAVDYVVNYRQNETTPAQVSSIIKLGTGNQIEIIRH